MKIRVLGSSGSQLPGLNLTSFLLDRTVLIDTGSAASMLDFDEQKRIELVLLSHIHIDHSLGLMLMADNLVGQTRKPIKILSIPEVLDGLRGHLFNNQVWPDFTSIPSAKSAVFSLQALTEGRTARAGKYAVTAARVSHSVPATGFVIGDGRSSLLYTGDTRATDRIWKLARTVRDLRGVIIETSFPNHMQGMADLSGHLTPRSLQAEIVKSGLRVPFYVYHLKALHLSRVQKEIAALKNPQIRFATEGATYSL